MRKLLSLTVILILGFSGFSFKDKTALFYIGTQDRSAHAAISLCELDLSTGKITLKDTFRTAPSPGYVSITPNKKNLYAITGDNKVSAYTIGVDHKLHFLNSQPSEGAGPCHVSVDPSGKMALVANYSGGSVTAYTLAADGKLNPATFTEQFTGTGPNTRRQEKAHAHYAATSPNGKFAYVADLGADRVMNFLADPQTGALKTNPAQTSFSAAAGSGPRHFVITPSGKNIYILNELNATLTAGSLDDKGVISSLGTYLTIPADYKDPNISSAIHLHPNGKFVYVSNRGHNSISAYRIKTDGTLEKVDEQTQAIKTPRDFNIDPSGKFMIVANQDNNNLIVYEINPKSGKFTFKHESIAVTSPICVAFL